MTSVYMLFAAMVLRIIGRGDVPEDFGACGNVGTEGARC